MILHIIYRDEKTSILGIYNHQKFQNILKQGEWYKNNDKIGYFRSGYSLGLQDDIVEELIPFGFKFVKKNSQNFSGKTL